MGVAAPAQTSLSSKGFRIGIFLGALFYGAVFLVLWLNSATTERNFSARLASQTVAITWEKPVTPPPATPQKEAQTPTAHEQAALQSNALPKAPIEGLSEKTADGTLPRIRESDKLAPFNAYRRPFTAPADGKALISIGVIGYGLSDSQSQAALAGLPPDVSLVLSAYALDPAGWMAKARERGHEVWLQIPVETAMYPRDDPGPQALLVGRLAQINLRNLDWALARTQGYAGLVTGYQATFMKSETDAATLINEAAARGLGVITGNAEPGQATDLLAAKDAIPYAHVNVWIGPGATPEKIATAFRKLELMAQTGGAATGFIAATPASLKALQVWIEGLGQKGFALAPLSVPAQKGK